MALEWLKQRYSEVAANLKTEVSKFKNKSFLEAVVAGCALVAHADGVVKPEEKQKMMGFLRNSEVLSVFDVQEVIAIFDKYSKQFEFDHQIGQASALQVVSKLKGKDAEARLMVRVCCAIGAADGNFDPDEKAVASKICAELGLNPKDFDL
ncbi:putative Tellurite resistance protein (tellurium resistance protein) [Candidatus Competibacter denitrificans Run_A_D11]|uniref:Tellurite resistance protein ( tellurium resistance protein) n=1 Tax=Candidatus Competibacter denitrificans Run_A_D11 TaxID=1400863 RepID=W6MBA6_9GAMM|nr:tellurite resistance TerB family protein [Candidatus Competibacter denitrificans]CDI01183.1 putative Tellurite resistance protein (tellurium resistance protein) [Candidatus Competibacter denitrificans Run_A_D11]HAS85657.1 Tellurite resistance TerB [Candidatus Competibacteraceae bacterium]HRC70758.1 tellurite resistance TerB family protein [Candidatus Competibacter denitrificans]